MKNRTRDIIQSSILIVMTYATTKVLLTSHISLSSDIGALMIIGITILIGFSLNYSYLVFKTHKDHTFKDDVYIKTLNKEITINYEVFALIDMGNVLYRHTNGKDPNHISNTVINKATINVLHSNMDNHLTHHFDYLEKNKGLVVSAKIGKSKFTPEKDKHLRLIFEYKLNKELNEINVRIGYEK